MTFTLDSIYAEVGTLYKKSHNCSSSMYLTKTFLNICGEKVQQYLKDRFYQSGSLVHSDFFCIRTLFLKGTLCLKQGSVSTPHCM